MMDYVLEPWANSFVLKLLSSWVFFPTPIAMKKELIQDPIFPHFPESECLVSGAQPLLTSHPPGGSDVSEHIPEPLAYERTT